ncbi:MAG: CinA family protein [Methanomassiliicoccales archaeon]|nr:CinA family protein [Methanomassiliicoccales archaeon]
MSIATEVAASLRSSGTTLALAESITGGLVASRLTDVPGASAFLLLGVVAYDGAAKCNVLGVSDRTMREQGAVSAETALEMAEGVRRLAGADLGASCTGIAGPTGATTDKPLGLTYLACVGNGYERVERMVFEGSRVQVKEQACDCLMRMVKEAAEVHAGQGCHKGIGE